MTEDNKKQDKEENTVNLNAKLRLKIDAHVVRQLGEELISGADQALLELVKNSHDADATKCFIIIDTKHRETINGQELIGRIQISDNGHGMSRETINESWLTISRSHKRLAKKEGRQTKLSRNYLGDKGLGRLSSMKLGQVLRIVTHHSPQLDGLSVQFDWSDFVEGTNLNEIRVVEKKIKAQGRTGTKLEIIGLNDVDQWDGEENLTRLQFKLSSLMSPFGHLPNFDLQIQANGTELDRQLVSDAFYQNSIGNFSFNYEGGELSCTGEVSLNFFKGNSTEDKVNYSRYIESDKGLNLSNHFHKSKKLSSYDLDFNIKDNKPFKFSKKVKWTDIDKGKGAKFEDPGDFSSSILYFFKTQINSVGQISASETKGLIDSLKGIWVYREGFRVGSERQYDWLRMGGEKTAGDGFYSLRPDNVVGYVAFAAHKNPNLVEKSDREGFIENSAYQGFWSITREMLKFVNSYLNETRRIAKQLSKEKRREEDDKPKNYTPEQAASEFSDLTKRAETQYTQNKAKSSSVSHAITEAKMDISNTLDDLLLDNAARLKIENLQRKVALVEAQVNDFSNDYSDFLRDLKKYRSTAETIIDKIDEFEEQILEYYDYVSIGLTALGFAHEIMPQVDNVRLNATALEKYLKSVKTRDPIPFRYLLSIKSEASVIAKTASMLNPLLRSERDVAETVNVVDIIENYLNMRADRFSKQNIKVNLHCRVDKLVVRFNRGKIIQILDNLVRNSEYWLGHFERHQKIDKEVNIEVTSIGFVVSDNGQGVSSGIESSLFDMFTTTKHKGEGQGLGLFIASNLAKQVDGDVTLLSDRNKYDRKFKFEVNLSGALVHE